MLRLTRSEVDYLLPIDDSGMLASLFHDLKNVQGTPLERTYISPDSYIQITASALGYLYDGQLNPIFEAQRASRMPSIFRLPDIRYSFVCLLTSQTLQTSTQTV